MTMQCLFSSRADLFKPRNAGAAKLLPNGILGPLARIRLETHSAHHPVNMQAAAFERGVSRCRPHQAGPARMRLHSICPRHISLMAQPRAVHASAQKVSELPTSLAKIVGAFQMVPDPMARYKQLLFYATKLEKLPAELHTAENKVEGCVSQVWVVPELRADGKVYWRADSDSQLTKGLAALLVTGLSGCTPKEIITLQPDFITMLGLQQSLTPSRNNGFLNMLKLMQKKTLALALAAEAAGSGLSSNGNGAVPAPPAPPPIPPASPPPPASQSSSGVPSSSSTPIQDGIRTKLTAALNPSRLVIEDQSAQHAGHAAMMAAPGRAGSSGETHFKVVLVSDAFEGKTLVARQRLVYQLLNDEFASGLHALSLDTKTPAEVAAQQ